MDATEVTRRVIHQMYDAVTRADLPALQAVLAQDIVVHEPAYLPYGGVYEGRDAFFGLVGEATKYLDVANVVIDQVIVDGDQGLGMLRIPVLSTGAHAVIAEQSIVRDGVIVEMWIYFHDTQGLDRIDRPDPSLAAGLGRAGDQ